MKKITVHLTNAKAKFFEQAAGERETRRSYSLKLSESDTVKILQQLGYVDTFTATLPFLRYDINGKKTPTGDLLFVKVVGDPYSRMVIDLNRRIING